MNIQDILNRAEQGLDGWHDPLVTSETEAQNVIADYVTTFTKNTVYLLTLFESSSQHQIELIRMISTFLGYKADEKLPALRQKVLHDYQSLEGL